MPYDGNGRYLYINDGGDVWNPGWKPTKGEAGAIRMPARAGVCADHGGAERGGRRRSCFFVPPGENAEIWRVRWRNKSGAAKSLKLFSFVEFCLFDALNDMTNYQRTYSIGEVEVEGGAIYHKTEYRERRNHYTLFACTRPVDGFDTSRDAFVGCIKGCTRRRRPLPEGVRGPRRLGGTRSGPIKSTWNWRRARSRK